MVKCLMRLLLILSFILLAGASCYLPAEENMDKKTRVSDFSKAKKFLRRIYRNIKIDFYCGCTFSVDAELEGRYRIDNEKCGLESRTGSPRSFLIEWEHIVPAYAFGKDLSCWTNSSCEVNGKFLKGRKCCQATNPLFNEMEADLHNLVPAPGEINNDRGHHPFGEIEGEKKSYGSCDFEVDFKNKLVEPREQIRGDIARIYFYMEKQWNVPLPDGKRALYETWDKKDPPDTYEIRRNEVIERVQGRTNPFIK